MLRAELAYFRIWLLGGLGIAAAVAIFVTVVFQFVGEEGPPSFAAAGIRGMFLILAPLIVGLISQTYRSEERRARLLFAGPLTPRQLGSINVLLGLIYLGIGVLTAGLTLATDALVTGHLEIESLNIVAYVGGLLLMILAMGLLGQEAIAAYRQRRTRAAAGAWAGFVGAVLLLTALSLVLSLRQGPFTWAGLNLGNVLVAIGCMAASIGLYGGRTDFTR